MKKYKISVLLKILLIIIICTKSVQRIQATIVVCGNLDDIVDIDEDLQEALVEERKIECLHKQEIEKENFNDNETCETTWDEVACWPQTPANKTLEILCPNYIDRFNRKDKAIKHCFFNKNTSKPEWSITDYSLCIEPPHCDDKCELESHMKYIITIRICGYVASMCSLTLSIFILLRPKLRCARNYVHINLFAAFAVRTILVMFLDSFLKSKSSMDLDPVPSPKPKIVNDELYHKFILCRIMMAVFRYSGSVYHMAIFSEGLFLVLLLKFPYYDEIKGSTLCILLSWFLPITWMLPWVLVRSFKEERINFWCWNNNSSYNLIIKIPHSLLLLLNITFAVFIITILYSKIRTRRISQEKLMKYRYFARSILILIPIFGLHFIFFAWLPYAELVDIDLGPCFELIALYIETFFDAFQGLVVSITSCFVHSEVKIEFIILTCELLKKIKCFQSLKFLESDYVNQLRYTQSETKNMHASHRSISEQKSNDRLMNSTKRKTSLNINTNNNELLPRASSVDEDEEYKLIMRGKDLQTGKKQNLNKARSLAFKYRQRKLSSASNTNPSNTSGISGFKCCSCLFTNQRNDFFSDSRRSRSFRLKRFNSHTNNNHTHTTPTTSTTTPNYNNIRLTTNCSKCNPKNLDSCKCLESKI